MKRLYRKIVKSFPKLILLPTCPSSFLTWDKITKVRKENGQQNLYSNIFGMKERTYTPTVYQSLLPFYVSLWLILLPLQAQRQRADWARGWWVTPMTIRSRASPPSVRLAAGGPGKGSRSFPGCSSILGKQSWYDGAYCVQNFQIRKPKYYGTYRSGIQNFSLYRTRAEGASNSGPTMKCDSTVIEMLRKFTTDITVPVV